MTLHNLLDANPLPDQASASGTNPAEPELENFIYLISHDLRNSLRALMEVPQWIEEDLKAEGHAIGDSIAENIALMNTHTRRLDRMMCDMLIYSRIGRMQPTGPLDLEEMLSDVLDEILVPKGFEVQRDLSCATITAGKNDIRTLLMALLSNAVKHHDRDSGTITVASRRVGDDCLIWVADDGPGIDPAQRDKVCEIMSTLKPRDMVEGSGMGLAMVRKIAKVYGGALIWPELAEQRGIAVGVRFPQAKNPPQD